PGEVALAHNGVLFLDEAPEFPRSVLELLRQPLQDGIVRITRAQGTVTYPAAITLVLASNPCPCGHYGDDRRCSCSATDVARYRRRLSGPILDRVDLHVTMSPVSPIELLDQPPGESSATVRARVVAARERQRARGQPVPNGQLHEKQLDDFAPMTPAARAVLHDGCVPLRLAGRRQGREGGSHARRSRRRRRHRRTARARCPELPYTAGRGALNVGIARLDPDPTAHAQSVDPPCSTFDAVRGSVRTMAAPPRP